MSIIIGHKIVLFPFSKERDAEYLAGLDSELASGIDEETVLYIVKTQAGRASKPVGIIAVAYKDDWKVDIFFAIDPAFYNGLDNFIAKKIESYVEDALATISDDLIGKNVRRIGYLLPPEERTIPMILERIGYEKEGVLRNYIKTDENIISDTIIYSLIVKEE